jgi:CheY-like chemotaxis protein
MKTVVLVVEDHPEIRKLIRMTLEIGDIDVYEADSGESGVRMLIGLRPDIVLMDIMMPGQIDGLQACRQIKDHPVLGATPVVMLTARGQQSDIQAGKDAGADEYLVKPFSPLQLLDTVKRLTVKDKCIAA